jgi:hypothetical protein
MPGAVRDRRPARERKTRLLLEALDGLRTLFGARLLKAAT